MDAGLHDFLVQDGARIDARFEGLVSWLSPWFETLGIRDGDLQRVLVLGGIVVFLWVGVRRVPRLAYRIGPRAGMVIEAGAMGSVLILLALTLPAWIVFRQTAIEHAVVALFSS